MTAPKPVLTDAPRPEKGETLKAAQLSPETLALMRRRRSLTAKDMGAPGPDGTQLAQLLEIAARVPDHGKLSPWRFVILEGEARGALGQTLADAYRTDHPEADETILEFEANRFLRAPLVVSVVSSIVKPHKIPEWEQILSAGAVCQNLLIAATAMGFAAQWLTEWYAYDPRIAAALGLDGSERIAGFVYIGAAGCDPLERPRPDLADLVQHWKP